MKHRLQGDKKTLRLRVALLGSCYAETGPSSRSPVGLLLRRDRLQAMVGGRGSFLPSLGGTLVLQMVFSFSLLQHTGGCTKPMREGTIPAKLRQDTSVVQISESKSELSIRMQKVTHARQLANILECSATQPALRLPQKLHHRVKVRSTENQKSTLPASCLIPSTREST